MFLRIVFNELGDFTQGTIRVLGSKSDGWNKPAELNIADLPATQKKTFNSMVTTLKEKEEPWVASQVWVYPSIVNVTPEASEPTMIPGLELIIEAVHDETGAVKTFSGDDSFKVTDKKYLNFFNYLTQ